MSPPTEFFPASSTQSVPVGIRLQVADALRAREDCLTVLDTLDALGLGNHVQVRQPQWAHGPACLGLRLHQRFMDACLGGFQTFGLCARLGLQAHLDDHDLLREIWLSLLAHPTGMDFPDADELLSAVRVRFNIVQAARRTALDFETAEAERPSDCWTYHPDSGFILRPGCALIPALIKATQPAVSGTRYSFSCYRATEYIILLAIAQEAALSNKSLLSHLEAQWALRAVMSRRFHEAFLREHGSLEHPLPIGYYIPGDRVWFRNPDEASSDVTGFEGSWVFYLGQDRFSNFWQRNQPFTLRAKCVELYHWRHGTWRDAAGELHMDEAEVARRVDETMADPAAMAQVFRRMFRLRDAGGVYAEGGCMDASRESPRWVRPGSSDIVLPGWY